MGKRSRESQKLRRAYKKCQKMLGCTARSSGSSPLAGSAVESRTTSPRHNFAIEKSTLSPISDSHSFVNSPAIFQATGLLSDSAATHEPYWSTDEEDTRSGPQEARPTVSTLMKEQNYETENVPVIISEDTRKLEVFITDPGVAEMRGSDVLKLSMKEYVERLHKKENKRQIVIKCLRDRIESKKSEMSNSLVT